ncbi:MAG: alpha-galactosidase, partial [Butyrivibrio sp.]|nr:alpha-galactosidase [Butyrivibrio sp.]
ESPEAVMCFSSKGINDLSHHMHDFVRKHVTRGEWRDKERPVLINNWEATYFNFTQAGLLKLAQTAAKAGIELFVMDDGWFGERNDDKRSLGDWKVNSKKLPDGIKGLTDKINALGMSCGIWVEPEMVNEESDLYKAHPDWAVKIPGHAHSEGRNQMNLDLTRVEVQDYIIDAMSEVFSSGNISYVKWDMNRIFSDRYSASLPAGRQGEFMHRYYIGLYRIMDTLVKKFPHILFEGCSAGGNRFDLGILSYFPQFWGSDDTDALVRSGIQEGYSYGYPQVCVGSHVSASPNHQTLHSTPLETRFEVAARGCLGYELNLNELSDAELKNISEQVEFYKKWRKTLQFGDFYRLGKNKCMIVDKDKSRAAVFVIETKSRPNSDFMQIKTKGLDEDRVYHITNRVTPLNVKDFGSLVNTMAPIHVKQDGIIHNVINHFVHMNGEKEDMLCSGAALNSCGVRLASSYAGTGYNENTRIMRPGDARMYLFEAE